MILIPARPTPHLQDVDWMMGNMDEVMAGVIEQCTCVIACHSEAYVL